MFNLRGQYRFFAGTPNEIVVPNTVTLLGAQSMLRQICRADIVDIAAGGNWYIGLCNETGIAITGDFDLTDLEEVAVANGYARQAVTRDITGWPTIGTFNGVPRAITAQVNFTASGGPFDIAFTRAFLASSASGTGGVLYSVSGKLATAITLLDTETHPVVYELYGDNT